ncbi:MAG: O-antigen ligase family protein, partial [Gammaproteobacteria bacterium]|nr:O-antigen ligase family protein [Gammaproteobacteria bacterium]
VVAVIALLGLVFSLGWFAGVARLPKRNLEKARWPLTTLGLFCVWVGLPLVPLPVNDVAWWSTTIDHQATMDSFILSIGFFLLAFLTIILVQSKRRALQLLYTLVLVGLLQAFYGSLMLLSGVEFGFFEAKEYGRGVATGTFINRNHLANLLILALSAGVGSLLAQMDLRGAQNTRQRLRSLLQAALGPKARLRIFMILMVIALVLTRSRMGNIAFFASITLVGLFALWRLREPSRPLIILVISVLVIDVFVVGTWFGVEQVIDRIQKTVQVENETWVVNDGNRIDVDRESMDIISQAPIAGYGGGTFYTVYPAWRGSDQKFVDHTHNDYLEFLVEHGLIGGLLLAWFLVLCFRQAIKGLEDRDRSRQFGICFASLMAMVAMLIHAMVDFSLHIPANAGWFVVLCVLPFTLTRLSYRV